MSPEPPDTATAGRGAEAPSGALPRPVHARFEHFELDEANAQLLRDGQPVPLAPTPFSVLCALAGQPGALLTKEALLDEVWGHRFVSESVLKTVITTLRTILQDDARKPRFIETVSRRGYRFIAATTTAVPQLRTAVASEFVRAHDPSFIGREEPLSRLHATWQRACSGKRTIVWVAGDPGIGKTTLIEHFVAGIGEVACIRGQCVEQYGAGEPYLPCLEALGELCRRDAAAVPLVRAIAPTWLLQLPWLGTAEEREALRRELAGVGPDRMLREMAELLDRYTEQHPLLIVTEDLHWSDRATLQLMEYIARRRGNAHLMWLSTFRLAEVVATDHPMNALRRELRLHELCDEIVLDPFSESEVARYVTLHAPTMAANETFVRALHGRTDGLPLFLASVLDDVVARKRDGGDAPGEEELARFAVPEGLAAILDHYIARLDEEQRDVLQAAAVCGVEFRVETVAAALGRDVTSVGETCERQARENLWLAPARAGEGTHADPVPYSFRHALFRQGLYERTLPSTRARLHAKVGAALERERAQGRNVAPAELAMHFDRARDTMAALRYFGEAAQAALQQLSPAECSSLTQHALVRLDQAPVSLERHGLELELATLHGVSAVQAAGVNEEAKAAFERAHRRLVDVPQHPMRGLLLHGYGFLLSMRAEYAEALAVAERAGALAAASDDPILMMTACSVQGHVHLMQGRPLAGRELIERALPSMEAIESMPALGFVTDPPVMLLGLLALHLLHLGLVKQSQVCMQRAHDRARAIRQPMSRLVAIWHNALIEVRLANPDRIALLADQMRVLVDEFDLAQGRPACEWFAGWVEARKGKPVEGYRRIREGYEANVRLGMICGGSENLAYATEALLLAGDMEGAERHVEEALRFASDHHERVYLPQLFLLEAAIARARRDSNAAGQSMRRAVHEARDQGSPWLETISLAELCETKVATKEDRSRLSALVDALPEAAETPLLKRARELVAATSRG
jgi:DNA-binding winged helix-turn-helix (wHTH) protein/Tfp pilus assembly protein PilF